LRNWVPWIQMLSMAFSRIRKWKWEVQEKKNSMDCSVCWRMACKASFLMEVNRYFQVDRQYSFNQFLLLVIHTITGIDYLQLLLLVPDFGVNFLNSIVDLFLYLALVILLNTCSSNYSQMYSNDLSCLLHYCLDFSFTKTSNIR